MDNVALCQIKNRIPLLKYRYIGSFPCDYDPTLSYDTFANINTQPNNMQGEHWIMIAKHRHPLYFADSLGRKDYNFLRRNYKRMILERLQLHQSLCGFYTISAASLLVKFGQEEITGVHDLIVLSFFSNYMKCSTKRNVNVQCIHFTFSFFYFLIKIFQLQINLFYITSSPKHGWKCLFNLFT